MSVCMSASLFLMHGQFSADMHQIWHVASSGWSWQLVSAARARRAATVIKSVGTVGRLVRI